MPAQVIKISGARQQNFLPVCLRRFQGAQFAVAAFNDIK
jgi:hypothetical protein